MKSRKIAIGLALLGTVTLPGLHRFYLGQSRWGILYVLLTWKTPLSRVASALEAAWYLFMDEAQFDWAFNQGADPATVPASGPAPGLSSAWSSLSSGLSTMAIMPLRRKPLSIDPKEVKAIADAVRSLEALRQDGLITETEFEQKRRQLLEQI